MDILNFLPKKTAERIQSRYEVAESIVLDGEYGVIRNAQFFESAKIKSIIDNDVHIVYSVQSVVGRDYTRNEIIPRDKTIFFQKRREEDCASAKMDDDVSKGRLKTFFKRNYIKKCNGLY